MSVVRSFVFAVGSGLVFGFTSFGGEHVSLNGSWDLAYFPQPTKGAVRDPVAIPKHKTLTATVPGNCEMELVKAGILPSPEVGLGQRAFRPYEGYQWLYTKTFDARPCDGEDGAKAELVFGGVDLYADVFLNGEKLGETANMLVEHRFDVTGRLKAKGNVLQVLFRSTFLETQRFTLGELGFLHSRGDVEPHRKASHMTGWDILPRLYVTGLWRDVSIDYLDPVRIDNVAWIFANPDLATGNADVKVQFRVQAPMSAFLDTYHVRVKLAFKDETALERQYVLTSSQHSFKFKNWDKVVKDLRFWWPRGMGEPNLYDATIEITDEKGAVVAADHRRVGIRTVRLEVRDAYPGKPGEFKFFVNGEPCYIRGSNWVPLDAFPCRQKDKMLAALEDYRDLNCNLVRVWGGGVYEPQEFFDWCDENGVMVWQDFMTGCSTFPQDDAYAALTRDEALKVVLAYRNHPSLALWSGNNENDNAFQWYSFLGQRPDPNRDRNSRKTIPDVLWEHDVTRSYLPSSPYWSSDFVAGLSQKTENHIWGARAYYKGDAYLKAPVLFVSEMGYHGCPSLESIRQMMPDEFVYPWTEIRNGGADAFADWDWNDAWTLKASNPYLDKTDQDLMRRNGHMVNEIKLMFGTCPTNLAEFVETSQLLQAEAYKTWVENYRACKFNGKNGLIFWNMREGWPGFNECVVDFYGRRKLGYYAIRNVHRNQLVAIREDGRVVAVNDTRHAVKGSVTVTDRTSGRTVFEKTYEVPANAALELGEIVWRGRGILDIDYEQDDVRSYNWYLYGVPPFDWTSCAEWLRESFRRIDVDVGRMTCGEQGKFELTTNNTAKERP